MTDLNSAPDINEMIMQQRVQKALAAAEKLLTEQKFVPLETGYGTEGQPILFGARYNLNHLDVTLSSWNFAWADENSANDINIQAQATGVGPEGLPLFDIKAPAWQGDLPTYSLQTQIMHFIESVLAQTGILWMHVKAGRVPTQALQAPEPSSIILP